jgi:hypothetical protein
MSQGQVAEKTFLGLPIVLVPSTHTEPWFMKQINPVADLLAVVYGGGEPAIEAAKALAGLPEWISVWQRKPPEKKRVFILRMDLVGRVPSVGYWKEGQLFTCGETGEEVMADFWLQPPEQPDGEKW